MSSRAERFASEAERLAGAQFRLHGRQPETGLDCVGLVAWSLEKAGGQLTGLPSYGLRNLSPEPFLQSAQTCGFSDASGAIRRGDLLFVAPGPCQQHLVVALGNNRFVHAHAGLRHVAVHSGLPAWQLLAHWRLTNDRE